MTRKNSSKEIPVVLKTFKTGFCRDIDMFNNEKEIFEVLSQNPQEDIVKCYGIVNINNTKYIVMEDLTKQNFTTLGNVFDKLDELQKENNQGKYQEYRQKVLTFLEKTNNFEKLKNILERINIYHNDIKKENIMVDLDSGVVKLIDLGRSVLKNKQKSSKPLNKVDEMSYESLQSAFYKLLDLDNKEKIQVSVL